MKIIYTKFVYTLWNTNALIFCCHSDENIFNTNNSNMKLLRADITRIGEPWTSFRSVIAKLLLDVEDENKFVKYKSP